MADEKISRREQVKELVETGNYTKAEIATALDVNVGSISSQLTYLRWMGNFILTDPETKKLSFCDEDTWNEYQEKVSAAKVAKKAGASKTPQERANSLAVTIKRQETQLKNISAKVAQLEKELEAEPGDSELEELLAEAKANETIVSLKLKRNKALAESLPEPAAEAVAEVDAEETAEETDEDLL